MRQRTVAIAAAAALLAAAPGLAQAERPAEIAGHPNLNGIWRALGSAHWNIEAHSAEAIEGFPGMGALAAIPAGQSVVVGETIPYTPEGLAKREENRAGWPASDPEAACYMPGIPRATYMPYPFQIVQGDGDILVAYAFAKSNRVIHMTEEVTAPFDQWMGVSNGRWEGAALVVTVTANDDRTWLDRAGNHHSYEMVVTERFTLIDENHIDYQATIEDPQTFTAPWTIRLPLYRDVSPDAELLDFNCVPFSEQLLYGHLEKGADRTEQPTD